MIRNQLNRKLTFFLIEEIISQVRGKLLNKFEVWEPYQSMQEGILNCFKT